MPKNLILIHLESISSTIFWQYREELKTIWRMWRQSYVYNRFYSAGTSTEMCIEYLLSGNATTSDWVSFFDQKKFPTARVFEELHRLGPSSLASYLHFAGYGKANRVYSVFEGFDVNAVTRTFQSVTGPSQDELLPIARSALAEAKMDGKPFLFQFTMSITHITAKDRVKEAAETFSDRFRLAYLRLDNAVNAFLQMLAEFKLLADSVIVFYGDHGDELWMHGLNKGWCHVITPYASQCWTPLFIYEHGVPPGSTNQLASTIDLMQTLLKRLVPDFVPEECRLNDTWTNRFGDAPSFAVPPLYPKTGTLAAYNDVPFHGIDLGAENRELAFSQNLYALQQEYNDVGKALVKGYAVTDGVYRVTVTSGGDSPREGGLEFFCDPLDPTSGRNLLDFFKLDVNGDIKEFYPPPEAVADEFSRVFNPEAVSHLIEMFQKLKAALYRHIRDKEDYARKLNDGRGSIMPEYAFKHSRRRSYRFQ